MEERICNACGGVIETGAVEIDGLFYCKDCYENEGLWYECAHCGKKMFVDSVELQSADGKYFCGDECMDEEGYFRCCVCEEVHSLADAIKVNDWHTSYLYCSENCALADDNTKCEDCGEWFSTSDVKWVKTPSGEVAICENCIDDGGYFYCDHCEEYFSRHYLWNYHDGFYICDYCSDNYVVCEDCGEIINVDDAHYHNGDYYCSECYDDGADYGGDINDWNYKPNPIFYESKDDDVDENLYMGVELEVDGGDNPRSLASELHDEYEEIYCKHDGSLNCGVEIVSHPCTLKYHTNELDWEGIMNMALNRDFKSHDAETCGLHVHVNRDFFGYSKEMRELNIAKVILLVNRFWDSHVIPFTRRQKSRIEQWAKKNEIGTIYSEDVEQAKKDKVIHRSARCGRYVAVNLQNCNTIEFRIFRGTLKYSTFIATLQFVDTLCRYACSISINEIDNIKWEDIFAGVEYGELKTYLSKRTDFDPNKAENVFAQITLLPPKDRREVDVGDTVRIREWDDMVAEFGRTESGIPCTYTFTGAMRHLCGLTGRVTSREYSRVYLTIPATHRFFISTDMIEILQ